MTAQRLVQSLFLHFCRFIALLAVILALKSWLEHPFEPAKPRPMKAAPAQLHVHLDSMSDCC